MQTTISRDFELLVFTTFLHGQHIFHPWRKFVRSISSIARSTSTSPIIPFSSHIQPHQHPRVGVACAVFPYLGNKVIDISHVLLIQRKKEPAKFTWSLPGGRLELGETIQEGALRELEEETGIKAIIANPMVPSYACTDAISSMYSNPTTTTETVIAFHYTMVHTLAYTFQPIQMNNNKELLLPYIEAKDDAMDAQWISLGENPVPAKYNSPTNSSQSILSMKQLKQQAKLVPLLEETLLIAQQIWRIHGFQPYQ